jgi:hypothetical protein
MKFGSFDEICQTAPLVICPLVGSDQGIEATCYSRNVEISTTLIFQPAVCFIHIVAIFMTGIMIYHVRSKYTAVGRKEIVTFFYLYALIELLAIFLDSGIIPTANAVYPWFTAVYTGLVTAAYTCLLINGFVGFQFAEDGTPLSLWGLRIACLALFALSFFISIATFKNVAGFSYMKPAGLWIIYLLWPLLCTAVYTISQLILVLRTLEDRWPIGDILFGTAFFAVGQVVLFAFSVRICDAVKHYIDGLFFFTLCILLAVMMVYKYWDSITKEDLEFSVGSKVAVWEVKDPLLAGRGGDYGDEMDNQSNYPGGPSGGMSSEGHYQGGYQGASHGYGYPPQGYGDRERY